MRAALVLLALGTLALARPAGSAPRLAYEGRVLSERQVEALLAPALRAPADSAALSRALDLLLARLQDLGHTRARVAGAWKDAATLELDVEEGPRLAFDAIAIAAPSAEDSAAFAGALGLTPGSPASPARVAAAVERAVRAISDDGYAYATLGVTGWDEGTAGVTLRLAGTRGPRVLISRARVDGLKITQPSFAQRALGRLDGQPWREGAALTARDRLAQTGLFQNVRFEGLDGEADWGRAQLVYTVEEPRYNRFEGAVGVQGDAGTVGLARLDLGNLLGTGRALGLAWQSRGRGRTDFGARYAEPLVFGLPLRAEARVDQQVQDSTYTRTAWGGRLQFLLSGQEKVDAGYEEQRVVQERGEVEEAHLQNTLFAIERSTLDEPLAPRRGTLTRVSGAQTFKSERLRPGGRRTARASAVELAAEILRPLSASSGLRLDLTAAGRFSSQRVLPVFERYPLGGTRTLRGYDEEAFRVDRYALSRLEWGRWLGERGQRAFLFWDHAWSGTRLALPAGGDRLEVAHRDGVGFGLRLEAAGGIVGVDYGLEPGRGPLEGKIHLQLVSAF